MQIVSQPLTLLDPLFPGLRLIEDFTHFADLLDDLPSEMSSYLPDIRELNQRAKLFVRERDSEPAAFSSFSEVKDIRQRLTKESLALRHYINIVITNLCNDPDTSGLVKYIKQSESGTL